MADINAIAEQFVDFYYKTFDENRANLAALYRDHSCLTFEQEQFQGAKAIVDKLSSLPFTKVAHKVTTRDAQPSSMSEAALIVLVTGALQVDDGANTLNYCQTFQLKPEGGSYYVYAGFIAVLQIQDLRVAADAVCGHPEMPGQPAMK